MKKAGAWDLMLHGNMFAQYLYESGEVHRRGQQFGSINWIMGMANRSVGTGRIGLRGMVSVEPWTIGGCGYPDLLATGEVCNADSLHDVQHPHDLFMEFAASYDRPVARGLRWQVYGGPAGEPALGPPGFPHRPSAFPNPIAPISHHWLDATHIAFGVVTTGVYGPRWKAEVSAFNGREPDDQRAGFDLGALDSVATRFSFLPSDRLALQVSGGHLHEAETGLGSLPRTDVNRFTASAIYHRPLRDGGQWASTVAYGVNSELANVLGELFQETTHALVIESSVHMKERHTGFGRFEVVGKPAHDLHAHEFRATIFTVAKLQGGYVRSMQGWHGWVPGAGVSVSASIVPPLLAPRYRGRVAPGFGVFLTLRPTSHRMY